MIVRGPRKERNFTILSNSLLRDGRLSFKARGLLTFILSQPENYEVRSEDLATDKDGRRAVLSGLGELREVGYLKTERRKDDLGRFRTVSVIYEEAQNRTDPECGSAHSVSPGEIGESPGHTESALCDSPKQPPLRRTSEPKELEELREPPTSLPEKLVQVPTATETVFAEWSSVTARGSRTKLDRKRRAVIDKALREYPLADVLDAVRGVRLSPFHMGDNDRKTTYNDLRHILGDAERLERFRDYQRTGVSPLREREKEMSEPAKVRYI